MAGVAFAVDGDGVGFATESYAASALYTTLASLSGAFWRIRRARAYLAGLESGDSQRSADERGRRPGFLLEGQGDGQTVFGRPASSSDSDRRRWCLTTRGGRAS